MRTSVSAGYGVKMKNIFGSQCDVPIQGLLLFSPKLTKTSSIRDRLLLKEQPFTVSLLRSLSTDGRTMRQMVPLVNFQHKVW